MSGRTLSLVLSLLDLKRISLVENSPMGWTGLDSDDLFPYVLHPRIDLTHIRSLTIATDTKERRADSGSHFRCNTALGRYRPHWDEISAKSIFTSHLRSLSLFSTYLRGLIPATFEAFEVCAKDGYRLENLVFEGSTASFNSQTHPESPFSDTTFESAMIYLSGLKSVEIKACSWIDDDLPFREWADSRYMNIRIMAGSDTDEASLVADPLAVISIARKPSSHHAALSTSIENLRRTQLIFSESGLEKQCRSVYLQIDGPIGDCRPKLDWTSREERESPSSQFICVAFDAMVQVSADKNDKLRSRHEGPRASRREMYSGRGDTSAGDTKDYRTLALAVVRLREVAPSGVGYATSFHIVDRQVMTSLLSGDRIGPHKRIWVVVATLVHVLLTMVHGIVGKRPTQFTTSIVLTTIWVELVSDPRLLNIREKTKTATASSSSPLRCYGRALLAMRIDRIDHSRRLSAQKNLSRFASWTWLTFREAFIRRCFMMRH
ncbi:hypothetical protein C8R45DRAFT_944098 [Mycena sanguinolenta]|nr:hypothetical protein C8R45DRAFT_944098 [Mycena sanguinolenta]